MTPPDPSGRIAQLEASLQEAQETLDAIRNGEVDAVVVGGPSGQIVYTLENADRPYRVLVEQMREGAVTLSDDGTILYCNRAFADLVGVSSALIVGRSFFGFIDDHSPLDHLFRTGGGLSIELEIGASSGRRVPANVSIVELGAEEAGTHLFCGIITDLTHNYERARDLAEANERLQAEIAERARAEQSLAVALDAADMGSWDYNLNERVTVRSTRHDAIYGFEPAKEGWTLGEMLSRYLPEDQESVRNAFRDAVTKGRVEFEHRIRRAGDEAMRWVYVKGRTFYRQGQAERIAGVIVDHTDRRMIDEQLRQAQKMEAVGQLTGGIAHDFNNLLAGISGSLELIEARLAEGRTAGLDRYIAAAQGASRRAAALTQRLLAFSRRQTLDPKPTDVNRLIAGMDDLIRRTVGPAISLQVIEAEDLWVARIDPSQLENALLNLSINARDAMPDGGNILIKTTNVARSGADIGSPDLPTGEYLCIDVADTGTGMSPDVIERAFDPFYTTKPLGEGTGLGLSMIHGFVRQSGGFVRIHSEVGKGTSMRLYLPRHLGVAEEAAAEDLSRSRDVGQGEAILVIDDEPVVRMLMVEVLEDSGFTAIEASDGPSGLRVLQSNAQIDLLITDVGLPGGMNGRQVADAARRSRPDLKVLFVTGYAETAVVGKGLLGPGMQVITKPFVMSHLSRKVREMIEDQPA